LRVAPDKNHIRRNPQYRLMTGYFNTKLNPYTAPALELISGFSSKETVSDAK